MIGDRKCRFKQRVRPMGGCSSGLATLRSRSIPHLKINRLAVRFAGTDPGPRRPPSAGPTTVHYHSVDLMVTTSPSPTYSGHALKSSCLRWISGSHVLRIHLQEGLDFHTHTHTGPSAANVTSLPPPPPPPDYHVLENKIVLQMHSLPLLAILNWKR